MANVGELMAKITLGGMDAVDRQLKRFSGSMKEASSKAGQMGKSLRQAGESLNEIGENIAPLSAGLLAIGGASVLASDNINSAMNNFQTKLGASGADLAKYESIMNDVASTGVGSFEDVSNAVITLGHNMKGLSPAEMTSLTEEAMQLATVMDTDVAQVSKVAGTMMKNFGITGSEAMDLIAKGYQNGMDYAGDYMDSLNEYSVYFDTLGFSANDMFNVLAKGAEEGAFNLDKVGDAVKEFGIRSKDGSDASREAFEALGMDAEKMTQTFAKGGEGAKKSYADVVNALSGVENQAERNAIGVALFGTQYEDMEADVIASTASITDSMKGFEGTAGEVAEANKDFGQQMQGYWNEIQVAIKPVGDVMRDFITDVMPPLVSGIKSLSDAFTGLSPTMQKVVLGFGAFVAFLPVMLIGLGSVASVMGVFMSGISVVTKGFGLLASAGVRLIAGFRKIMAVFNVLRILFMANPFALLASAVIGVVVLIVQNWGKVKSATVETFTAMGTIFSTIWNGFLAVVNYVVSGILAGWAIFSAGFMSALSAIGSFFSSVWQGIASVAQVVWSRLVVAVTSTFDAIKSIVQSAFNVIKTIFLVALGILVTLLAPLWNAFATGWNKMVTVAQSALSKIRSWLQSAITFMVGLWNKFKSMVSNIWNSIYSNVIAPVVAKIKSIVNTLIAKAQSVMKSVKSAFSSAWNAIYGNIISPIINRIKSTINTIISKARSVMSSVRSAFSSAWNAIKSLVSSVINGIMNTIQKIVAKARSVGSSVKSTLSSAFNSVKNTVSSAIGKIIDKIQGIWNKAKTVASNIKSAFSNLFSGIKVPSFSMGGWTYKDLPKLPKMKVQWNASGGILDSATMIGAGEKGAEAIVPLSSQRRMKPFAQAVSRFMPDGGGKSSGDTNINVSQLIVREEADVTKIAQELNRLQERKDRARGNISFA